MLLRVAALAVAPQVIRVLTRPSQAEAQRPIPVVAAEQRTEKPAPVVCSPPKKVQIPPPPLRQNSVSKGQSPILRAWWAPRGSRGPPSPRAGSRSWAYLHPRSYSINYSDPSGLEAPPRGGYESGMPNVFGLSPSEARWATVDAVAMIGLGAGMAYEVWLLAGPAGEYLFLRYQMRGRGPSPCPPAPRRGGNTKSAQAGNDIHYDELNGGTGKSGPSKFQEKYNETGATHAKRGQPGPDITIDKNTRHPSTYPGSNWPAGAQEWKASTRHNYVAVRRHRKSIYPLAQKMAIVR